MAMAPAHGFFITAPPLNTLLLLLNTPRLTSLCLKPHTALLTTTLFPSSSSAHAHLSSTAKVRRTAGVELSNVLVEREFQELNLKQISEQVGGVRIRQHVNPLKASLMAPVLPPKWEEVFIDPSLPLMVDIGCGSGRFVMLMARKKSGFCNFLGLEIREKLVSRSNLWASGLNLKNIYFMVANATFAFDSILSGYPGKLTYVSILCPDPHFKKRHHKRRIVQKSLVDAIIKHLSSGGKLFLQSDVLEVAVDMRQQFDALVGVLLACDNQSNSSRHDNDGWLLENPYGIPTEREIHALSQGGQIYRRLYTRLSD